MGKLISHGCPKCSGPMTIKENNSDGSFFQSCVKFPKCRGTRPLTRELAPGLSISPEIYNKLFGAQSAGSKEPQEYDIAMDEFVNIDSEVESPGLTEEESP